MPEPAVTVFTARRFQTMEPSTPVVEAVAVDPASELILDVGPLDQLTAWLDGLNRPYTIDRTLAEHIVFPGFIDPHLHPAMAAVLLPMHFTTVVPWDLPWSSVGTVRTPEELGARLVELDETLASGEPLFTWGHHPIWHGDVDRASLNQISTTRPIVVWHRGYHSLIVNDACLDWMTLDREAAARHPQIDLDRGAFFENGLAVANRHFRSYTMDPDRFRGGLDRMREVIHRGGHTMIGDAAFGMYGFEQDWDHLHAVMEQPDTPFRIQLMPFAPTPDGAGASGRPPTEDEVRAAAERQAGLAERNTSRLIFSDHVKMFADGGFFAELMMLKPPGYLDGHIGEWLTAPEAFMAQARLAWRARFKIHVHVTGDLGVELALSTLETLQDEQPRVDHRFTFEHFGVSTPEQVARMARAGALASVNVYYLYELAEAFARHTLGYERASQMSRLGSLERAGVPFALHSDFTMAPAQPLNNAWIAANRLTESGAVMAPNERASLDAALRAITTNAALVLGREDEVGSIRAGKRADFTVLEADPYEVGVEGLADIGLWGTVFGGHLHPI